MNRRVGFVKPIALAAALILAPACSRSDDKAQDQAPTTADSVEEQTTTTEQPRQIEPTDWEMTCEDGTRLTFQEDTEEEITVSDGPSDSFRTQVYVDESDFNQAVSIVNPLSPKNISGMLDANTPLNAYGVNASRILLFDRETRLSVGAHESWILITPLANGAQLSNFMFSTQDMISRVPEGVTTTTVAPEADYEYKPRNIVNVRDTEDGLKIVFFESDDEDAEPKLEDIGTEDAPTQLSHNVVDANGAPSSLRCEYYKLDGPAEPPTPPVIANDRSFA